MTRSTWQRSQQRPSLIGCANTRRRGAMLGAARGALRPTGWVSVLFIALDLRARSLRLLVGVRGQRRESEVGQVPLVDAAVFLIAKLTPANIVGLGINVSQWPPPSAG